MRVSSVQFQFQSELIKSEIAELIPQKSEDVRQQVLDRLREPCGRLQEVQGKDGQGGAQVGTCQCLLRFLNEIFKFTLVSHCGST